jgi:Na+(H+)/acetate symporter ActP
MFNGLFKVPMQFFILFVGVSVFIFFQYQKAPLHFNPANVEIVEESGKIEEYQEIESAYTAVFEEKRKSLDQLILLKNGGSGDLSGARSELNTLHQEELSLRQQADQLIKSVNSDLDTEDSDYVFITYILNYLPIGLIGLLLAVIFSAAMSSTASELNALATTTVVDIYKRSWMPNRDDFHYLRASKLFTVFWGIIALLFATFASLFDNLIEAVNIIGSIFYGTILGIFVVAFFIKKIKGFAVFTGALIAEALVLIIYFGEFEYQFLWYSLKLDIAYLWLNAIGCIFVLVLGYLIQIIRE